MPGASRICTPASGDPVAPLPCNGASGSIALFESADGLQWKTTEQPKVVESKFKWADRTLSNSNVERPALLLDNGIPVALFGATDGYKKNGRISCNVHIPLKPSILESERP